VPTEAAGQAGAPTGAGSAPEGRIEPRAIARVACRRGVPKRALPEKGRREWHFTAKRGPALGAIPVSVSRRLQDIRTGAVHVGWRGPRQKFSNCCHPERGRAPAHFSARETRVEGSLGFLAYNTSAALNHDACASANFPFFHCKSPIINLVFSPASPHISNVLLS